MSEVPLYAENTVCKATRGGAPERSSLSLDCPPRLLREVEVHFHAELDSPVLAHRPRLVCCCQIKHCAHPFPHRGSFDRSLSIVEIVIIADDAENLVVDVQDRALEVHGAGGPLLERETNPMREVRDV